MNPDVESKAIKTLKQYGMLESRAKSGLQPWLKLSVVWSLFFPVVDGHGLEIYFQALGLVLEYNTESLIEACFTAV